MSILSNEVIRYYMQISSTLTIHSLSVFEFAGTTAKLHGLRSDDVRNKRSERTDLA